MEEQNNNKAATKRNPRYRRTKKPEAALAQAAPEEKAAVAAAEKQAPKRRAPKAKGQENPNQPSLKIIPLGGIGEVGKNMTAFEYGDDILVVDCGVLFPEEDMLGIDYVIPDTEYLVQNKSKVKAFVFTHGHEDHIGATPYILKDFSQVPVYGGQLTTALIQYKLDEHGVKNIKLENIKAGSKIKAGRFQVTFLRVCHSIADSFALAIQTPVGVVVYTGDFKIDHTPLDGQKMDLAAFGKLGQEGVLLLMSDSTNAERQGYTMSEQRVGESLDDLFEQAHGRIVLATFSSNISRIQQVIHIAEKRGRKVFFAGRSLLRITEIAMGIGYLKVKQGTLVDDRRIDGLEPEQVVIITTGSQGEPMSGLVRMANNEHRTIAIRPDDMVIISASPIPGNEKAVSSVIDKLYQKGAQVVYEGMREIHVSGHACQEEQKMMIALTRPKFFMPIHGEYRHLRRHALTAENQGIKAGNIVIAGNGSIVELSRDRIRLTGSVPAEGVLVDGSGIGDVGNVVLKDRRILSEDGLFVAVVAIDRNTGAPVSGPEIISRGFIYMRESEQMIGKAKDIVRNIVLENQKSHARGEFGNLRNAIRSGLRNYLYTETKRNPMILPMILEI